RPRGSGPARGVRRRRGRSPRRRPPPPRPLEWLRPLPRWHGRGCAPCARRPQPRSAACRTWHLIVSVDSIEDSGLLSQFVASPETANCVAGGAKRTTVRPFLVSI